MIKYQLTCGNGHDFDSWFSSSNSFEEQRLKGFVTCPHCGVDKVEKSVMAPQVARSYRAPAVLEPAALAMRRKLTALYRQATEHADNVGTAFPEEARKMHYGEAEARPIYGKSTLGEARDMVEEGIPILPLPPVPDEQN